MRFNQHSLLVGRHALLSPSQSSWVNYDEDQLDRRYFTMAAAARGTALHELAHRMITLRRRAPEDPPDAFNLYVNDAIGYGMASEQTLYYSENAFGHTDAIKFSDDFLRIHDLKTGETEAKVRQLEVYAALFCLEYHFEPNQIGIELRLYQDPEVTVYDADPNEIFHIMDRIVTLDKRIKELREEEL